MNLVIMMYGKCCMGLMMVLFINSNLCMSQLMVLCVNGGPKSNDGAMCKKLCMSQLMVLYKYMVLCMGLVRGPQFLLDSVSLTAGISVCRSFVDCCLV